MAQPFKKKKTKDPPSLIIGLQSTKIPTANGTVGIEIEVEGKSLPVATAVPLPWVYKPDHSLRGEESAEYVLNKPIEFKEVAKSLDTLWKVFKDKKSVFDDSNRTSVHVHLNCQSFFMNRLTSFMALYIIVEDILAQWCGDHRVGNLFCLRVKDAPGIIRQIKDFIQEDGGIRLSDGLRYSAMNTNALQKYGSLEFRTLRGCSDPQLIKDWVSILERLYNLSGEFSDPRDICGQFSAYGPSEFFINVFGDVLPTVMAGIEMSESEIADSLFEGMRMAQELCYCRDWSKFLTLEVKPDPFGRKTAYVARKIQEGIIDGPVIDAPMTPDFGQVTFAVEDEDEEMMEEPDWEPPQMWDN